MSEELEELLLSLLFISPFAFPSIVVVAVEAADGDVDDVLNNCSHESRAVEVLLN